MKTRPRRVYITRCVISVNVRVALRAAWSRDQRHRRSGASRTAPNVPALSPRRTVRFPAELALGLSVPNRSATRPVTGRNCYERGPRGTTVQIWTVDGRVRWQYQRWSATECQERESPKICKTSIPGSNPGGASIFTRKFNRLVRERDSQPLMRGLNWTEPASLSDLPQSGNALILRRLREVTIRR
jgi:hypothetical protein